MEGEARRGCLEIPWIKTAELTESYIWDADEYISRQGLAGSSAKMLPPGTVLVAMYGATAGRVGILGVEAACNQASCALIVDPDEAIDRWLFYALVNRSGDLVDIGANGAAQQNLSARTIKQFPIMVPPIGEQRAIAEVLGALDDKIEANRKLAATADDLAVSLLSAFGLTVPLREVAEQSKVSLNPQSLHGEVVAHYSLPAFDEGDGPERVAAADIKSNKYHLRQPSVLVSKLNPRFPRVWNVPEVGGSLALASTEFVVLEPTKCSTHVLWAMTRHTRFARSLQGLVAGTSGSHQRVRPAEILDTAVPDPCSVPVEVQSLVDATVRRSLAAGKENHSLAVLRDTLLPKLMSGQLRVQESERLVANAV